MQDETIIWITGATDGVGAALAQTAPYPGARIINLSRRQHETYESVIFDLTKPETWDGVRRHFQETLANFSGRRALFFNSATVTSTGFIGKLDSGEYERAIVGSLAAPLVLAEAFMSACKGPYEAGLVLMSSGAAAVPLPGMASYCASKGALEHWAEVVSREREQQGGQGPWVVAVRPGGIATEAVKRSAERDPKIYPRAPRIKANLKFRPTPEEAAKRIWSVLPPEPPVSVISLAPPLDEPQFRYGHERTKVVEWPVWKLVYP